MMVAICLFACVTLILCCSVHTGSVADSRISKMFEDK